MKRKHGLNTSQEDFARKRCEALGKFQFVRDNFRNAEKKIKADLEKTRLIWKKLGERFKWWQSLP